jgi:hypothetical protein
MQDLEKDAFWRAKVSNLMRGVVRRCGSEVSATLNFSIVILPGYYRGQRYGKTLPKLYDNRPLIHPRR